MGGSCPCVESISVCKALVCFTKVYKGEGEVAVFSAK